MYFGRVVPRLGLPCKVTVRNGEYCEWIYSYHFERTEKNGDVLLNTGYTFVKSKRGDIMPPNAVMTGAAGRCDAVLVGRVGGNVPCKVNVRDGKIWDFWFCNRGEKSVKMGEVLLLTNDTDDDE